MATASNTKNSAVSTDVLLDNLNPYHELTVLKGQNETDLLEQIRAIRRPFKIHAMYFGNGRHYAWISGDHRLNQKRRGRPPKKKD